MPAYMKLPGRNQPAASRGPQWHSSQIMDEIGPTERGRRAPAAKRSKKRRTRKLRCAKPSAKQPNFRRTINRTNRKIRLWRHCHAGHAPKQTAYGNQMTALPSSIDPRSREFADNAAAMQELVKEFRAKVDAAMQGGSEEARARHIARGKLLARERVDLLLDPGTPFLELSPLAAYGMYGGDVPAAGIDHRHRPRQRPRMRDRRQRRDGQGRHLLPDDGEEASARAGDRAREPPALHLPGRFRRRHSCRSRTRSFPTASISAASSTIRRTCRRRASRRSRW